jgi:hypothetical protein
MEFSLLDDYSMEIMGTVFHDQYMLVGLPVLSHVPGHIACQLSQLLE